jgi:hypothetical protein
VAAILQQVNSAKSPSASGGSFRGTGMMTTLRESHLLMDSFFIGALCIKGGMPRGFCLLKFLPYCLYWWWLLGRGSWSSLFSEGLIELLVFVGL